MHALLTSERERGYPCTGKHVQATQLPRPPPRQPSSSPAFLMAATSIFSAGCPSSASLRSRVLSSSPWLSSMNTLSVVTFWNFTNLRRARARLGSCQTRRRMRVRRAPDAGLARHAGPRPDQEDSACRSASVRRRAGHSCGNRPVRRAPLLAHKHFRPSVTSAVTGAARGARLSASGRPSRSSSDSANCCVGGSDAASEKPSEGWLVKSFTVRGACPSAAALTTSPLSFTAARAGGSARLPVASGLRLAWLPAL